MMQILKFLFAGKTAKTRFDRRLAMLTRRQPAPVTGRVVFRTRPSRQEA